MVDEALKTIFRAVWSVGPLIDFKAGVLLRMRTHFVDKLGLMAATINDVVLDPELLQEFLLKDERVGRVNASAWMRALRDFEETPSEASSQRTPRRLAGSSESDKSGNYGPSLYMQSMVSGQLGFKSAAERASRETGRLVTYAKMLEKPDETSPDYRHNFSSTVRDYG